LNVDLALGKNFTIFPPTADANDDNGHGTLIAGIAGLKKFTWTGNIKICSGVSMGARLVPIKVLDRDGWGYWSHILAALDYIGENSKIGDVINLSLGDYPITDCKKEIPGLPEILTELGQQRFVVMAAGNNMDDSNKSLPGCLDENGLVTVAAVNCTLNCSLYSNYGSSVDYVAVGTDVISTFLYDATAAKWTYMVVSGTSMATAVISGVIHSTGKLPVKGKMVGCGLPGSSTITDYPMGTK
jgi:subtilisin family serine protease